MCVEILESKRCGSCISLQLLSSSPLEIFTQAILGCPDPGDNPQKSSNGRSHRWIGFRATTRCSRTQRLHGYTSQLRHSIRRDIGSRSPPSFFCRGFRVLLNIWIGRLRVLVNGRYVVRSPNGTKRCYPHEDTWDHLCVPVPIAFRGS